MKKRQVKKRSLSLRRTHLAVRKDLLRQAVRKSEGRYVW
jgi:hypothetical protein